jgi:hypothetical protein
MCSRFSLAEGRDFLAARLGVSAVSLANYRARYNIAPRQEHSSEPNMTSHPIGREVGIVNHSRKARPRAVFDKCQG